MNLTPRFLAAASCLLVLLLLPASVGAQAGRGRAEQELNRTETILSRARASLASRGSTEARDLLKNAIDHQMNARGLFARGRAQAAVGETLLARRLAERALLGSGGADRGDTRVDLERMLRRTDRRLAVAREWLRNRGSGDPDLAAHLTTAERQMERARSAFRDGRAEETLKHLAAVRQALAAFPGFADVDAVSAHIARQLDRTDDLLGAMENALPSGSVRRLDAAREAQRRARERLKGGQPGQAMKLGAEARAHAVRVWNESGAAPDRNVTRSLVEANESAILELQALSERHDPDTGGRLLNEARITQTRARRLLDEGNLGAGWQAALETSRLLWDARQSLFQDARP
jgi:tetratricopeptide (TPR) repeat protein